MDGTVWDKWSIECKTYSEFEWRQNRGPCKAESQEGHGSTPWAALRHREDTAHAPSASPFLSQSPPATNKYKTYFLEFWLKLKEALQLFIDFCLQ